jgi:hypothetical protein
VATREIDGTPLGPFYLYGKRNDDPNDFIPHDYRRELRGLRLISAWINNFDVHTGNVGDYYVNEGGQHFVKHYFTRFTSTLGSFILGVQPASRGAQNYLDPHEIAISTLTLGFKVDQWEKNWAKFDPKRYPSIGFIPTEGFEPLSYKFVFPAPAFENMTDLDGFWAAKIITGFDNSTLKQIVRQGHYSDSAATDYLVSLLAQRRDVIGRSYFTKLNPLDGFSLDVSRNPAILKFTDLAVRLGYRDANHTTYQAEVRRNGSLLMRSTEWRTQERLILPKLQSTNRGGQWEVTIRLKEDGAKEYSSPVRVYIEYDIDGQPVLVGLLRD